MLSLDSPLWHGLMHAYGPAADTPRLLRQLEDLPKSDGGSEPWHSIFSSLAHQGDVYPASFAAVPHVVRILGKAPAEADAAFFHFPAWVEICRQHKSVAIPEELEAPYFSALSQLPQLVAAAADREWTADFLRCALAATAAAKGSVHIAEAALELTPSVAEDFLTWLHSQ